MLVRHLQSYVLITGASSGIGSAFAHEYAQAGYSLVLSGRNIRALENLAAEVSEKFSVPAEVLPADLLQEEDLQKLVERIKSVEAPVEILVNNAGFGLGKAFLDAPIQDHLAQIQVLAKAPLVLMHTALEVMVSRGRGRIINVASVAAFTPGGTYSAVKRFLVSISESAHLQYAVAGITVTAVCPGLTRSGFHRAMKVDAPALPGWLWLDAQTVAKSAIKANLRCKALHVPSLPYKMLVTASRLIPPAVSSRAIDLTRNY